MEEVDQLTPLEQQLDLEIEEKEAELETIKEKKLAELNVPRAPQPADQAAHAQVQMLMQQVNQLQQVLNSMTMQQREAPG